MRRSREEVVLEEGTVHAKGTHVCAQLSFIGSGGLETPK